MTVELRTVTILSDIVFTFFTIIYVIFFIIILRPLYKFCKTRTALYILFSKSFANFIFQFISIYQLSTKYILPPSTNLLIIKYCLFPISQIILNGTFIHMAGLAINRFHSVFFIFTYQSAWKLRNVKYFILTLWLITIIVTIIQMTLVYMNVNGYLSVLYKGIFTSGDVVYLSSFCFSAAIYLTILTKFCYKYITKNINNNNTKQMKQIYNTGSNIYWNKN
ncbi:hypothetical protein Mgra_00003814 [Meloidogyne graminicola]|uniref:Uncharacterized protein n=1 Tax=Meloidogyne graminicola TaxID=189291 RepID=A0A8S9ZT34_9BILA|nr:hypothetical protein Mgra_00003814 [Meloidogyne graminicola]